MLDVKLIKDDPERIKKGIKDRGYDPALVNQVLEIYETRQHLLQETENLRAQRNKLNKEDREKGRKIKEMLNQREPDLRTAEEKLKEILCQIPNLPAADVPLGKNDSENVEIRRWGKPRRFSFKPRDHQELGEELDIIDLTRAAKVSGSRFGYFKGAGALLSLSLMWHVFHKLAKKGFIANLPPVITKKEVEWGMGYTEYGGWDQMYVFEKDGLVFVSSSEHSVIPMHKDEILSEECLPLRYVNFSSCFRREAGTYGRDTRGIFRVHQFNKVEMNVYVHPETEISDQECLHLLSLEEELLQELNLPYRVMNCCTGDLPLPNRRMYDVEAWFPGENRYREVQSCSNCTDYQTRRLNIRVKTKEGIKFAHALNATGITDRATIAIMENYQEKDGSIKVPKILRKYMGINKIKKKP